MCRDALGDSVVLCCSGPSLRAVDVRVPGLPLVAVSTAVNNEQCRHPDAWCFADRLNPSHGERRLELLRDPTIIKVTPTHVHVPNAPNLHRVRYVHGQKNEKMAWRQGRRPFDGKLPLLRGCHKSMVFAMQWLAFIGVRKIIICGADMTSGGKWEQKYGYAKLGKNKSVRLQCTALKHTFNTLKEWRRYWEEAGVTMLAWSPGGRINELMEPYEPPTEHLRTVHPGTSWPPAPL